MSVERRDDSTHRGQAPKRDGGRSQYLPKRFHKEAVWRAEGQAYSILLDERPVKTPCGNALILPGQELAMEIAQEWQEQGEHIDPETMPLTKLAYTAIDHVAGRKQEIIEDILSFAGSDLLCYRADGPDGLDALQKEHWDPVLDWFAASLNARFTVAVGVVHVGQPEDALSAIRDVLTVYDPFRLAALRNVTTLTGSALLAVALSIRKLSAEEAWRAAHVDEDFQISKWGEDSQAQARRAKRWTEIVASHRFDVLAAAT